MQQPPFHGIASQVLGNLNQKNQTFATITKGINLYPVNSSICRIEFVHIRIFGYHDMSKLFYHASINLHILLFYIWLIQVNF